MADVDLRMKLLNAKLKAKKVESSAGKATGKSYICPPVAKDVQSSFHKNRMWWCAQCGNVFYSACRCFSYLHRSDTQNRIRRHTVREGAPVPISLKN